MDLSSKSIAAMLSAATLPREPERRLQGAIADTFRAHGVPFEREVRLSDEDIIDFVVGDGLGLEVKIDGSLSEVTRQLHRYAQSDRVTSLLLVTTRARHRGVPPSFSTKPIHSLFLIRGAL